MNLAPNTAAGYTLNALGNYDHRHAIVGRAIITGPHDSGGNFTDVDPEVEERVRMDMRAFDRAMSRTADDLAQERPGADRPLGPGLAATVTERA